MPEVVVLLALLEVTDAMLNGRTENESTEQAGAMAVKALQAEVVHSFITASKFFQDELRVNDGDKEAPAPPLAKVTLWVAPASTAALLVQLLLQVRAESVPQALSLLSTSFTCAYLAPAVE